MRDASTAKLWRGPLRLLALLLALPLRAANEPIRVDLSINSANVGDVRVVGKDVLPGSLLPGAGVELPGAELNGSTLKTGEIPALPLSTIAAPQTVPSQLENGSIHEALQTPQGDLVQPIQTAKPESVLASLQSLSPRGENYSQFYDRYKPVVTTSYIGDGSRKSDDGPRRPRGVVKIDVNVVHGPKDVVDLIPNGVNSDSLKAKLLDNVDTMAPYRIYTYHDSKGGTFAGIDLSLNPKLVEILPEQQSHEVTLIKKIQLLNKDLQVLIRETGKTPDLVVGGVVTELKSLMGDSVDVTFLLNKANSQVHEHAQRHALGNGAVAMDLTKETAFTPELEKKVAADIENWRRMPAGYEIPGFYHGPRYKKEAISLDKIYIFAGSDLRMFVRAKDDSFRLAAPGEIPFALSGEMPGLKRHQVHLSKQALARPPPERTAAHDAYDAMYLVKELRSLVAAGRVKAAFEAWREFESDAGPDKVRSAKNMIRDIWPQIVRGQKKSKGDRRGR